MVAFTVELGVGQQRSCVEPMEALESTSGTSNETSSLRPASASALPAEYYATHWYAAYTCANHEKRVAEQLAQYALEHFLPLYESVRRWKDRRVRLQLPLFPGYVFIRLPLRQRLQVLQIPSMVRLVSFGGQPALLREEEIEGLRRALAQGVRAKPYPYITVGRRVRITAGPLAGCEGVLVRKKSNLHVVLSVDLIQRSVMVDVDAADIEPLFGSGNSIRERRAAVAGH